jgi:hypothetical protein
MPPRLPRRHPRYDAQGHLVGYLSASGHLEADALHADKAWQQTEGEAAVGKQALLEDDHVGRITDVIFELASGEIVAYEFTDEAGAPHYLPASALSKETGSALCFPGQARDLIADDLPALGDALQWGANADTGEFSVVEDLGDRA